MRTAWLTIVVAASACGKSKPAPRADDPGALALGPVVTVPKEPPPNAEQAQRRARSETRLKSEGVRVNQSLPVLEDVAHSHIREVKAIVVRAFALEVVARKADGLDAASVKREIDRAGVADHFTAAEATFLATTEPSAEDLAKFVWQYECANVMLWALGAVDRLDPPKTEVDLRALGARFQAGGVRELLGAAKPRTAAEILDEADLIYRYDWACVDARVTNHPPPTAINCDVVLERHRALNWLVEYLDAEWDDVSTDT